MLLLLLLLLMMMMMAAAAVVVVVMMLMMTATRGARACVRLAQKLMRRGSERVHPAAVVEPRNNAPRRVWLRRPHRRLPQPTESNQPLSTTAAGPPTPCSAAGGCGCGGGGWWWVVVVVGWASADTDTDIAIPNSQ